MIQIIEGVSGAGKTEELYCRIIKASVENPEHRYYLVVPEQFTMQAQRDIVLRHPRGGTMNIDVVSFNRLAYRIFEELNVHLDRVLEDFGKSMLLKQILTKHRKELTYLGKFYNKIGFIDELKSLFTEFFQYRVGAEELSAFYNNLSEEDTLKRKLRDILAVWNYFLEELQGKYIVSEHILEHFAKVLNRSALLTGSELFFDGFTGFTPIQYHVLNCLTHKVSGMTFTLTMDKASADAENLQEYELFYLSKDTVARLHRVADAAELACEEQFLEPVPDKNRYVGHPSLGFLEQNLFRYPYKEFAESPEDIRLRSMRNPRNEIHSIARQIRRLVREEGYRYREIAVIHGATEEIAPYVEDCFTNLHIPYFIDATHPLSMNPCMEGIRTILRVACEDYSYDSLFRLLKTGILNSGLTLDEIEELENLALRRGIRGKNWWQSYAKGENSLSEPAGKMLACVGKYTDRMQDAKSVKDYLAILQEFIENEGLYDKIENLANDLENVGEHEKAHCYGQTPAFLDEILAKLQEILGEEEMKPEEFLEILDTGIDKLQVGIIPHGLDYVTVGDLSRSRLSGVKVLFVAGLNDGIIPKQAGSAGILSSLDRKALTGLNPDLELAPDAKTRIFVEQFYIYQNITKAAERVYLSYHLQDGDGKEALPAYVIGRIQKIFPKLILEPDAVSGLCTELVETPEDSFPLLAEGLKGTELSDGEQAVWKSLYDHVAFASMAVAEQLSAGNAYSNVQKPISPAAAKALYGQEIRLSVSRLENYASCPFQYFLRYGLGLRPRRTYEINNADEGQLNHAVVEQVFRKVETRSAEKISDYENPAVANPWEQVSEDELQAYVDEAVNIWLEERENFYQDSKTNEAMLKKLKKSCYYAIRDLKDKVLYGKMIPYRFEAKFNTNDSDKVLNNLPSASIELSDDTKMHLNGVIDRIDLARKEQTIYVQITDYKSSGKKFEPKKLHAGTQLQLLVYTGIIMEALGIEFPNCTIVPVGSLYYAMKEPMCDLKDSCKEADELEKDLATKVPKESHMEGIINFDHPSYELLGGEPVIGTSKKYFKESEHVVTTDRYRELVAEAMEESRRTAKAMLSGEIPIRPVVDGRNAPCDYCDYREICRFDSQDGGNHKISCYTAEKIRKGADVKEEGV